MLLLWRFSYDNHRYQQDDECLELLKMDEGIRNLFETGAEISIAKMREHIDEMRIMFFQMQLVSIFRMLTI